MTITQKRRLVRSGALHPIALVRDDLIARAGNHPVWTDVDLTSFPWPLGRTLYDLVAYICQQHFLRLAISERHYYRLLEAVEMKVFGRINPERSPE